MKYAPCVSDYVSCFRCLVTLMHNIDVACQVVLDVPVDDRGTEAPVLSYYEADKGLV